MTAELGDPLDRQMRLRYAGACRRCGVSIAAGAPAVYEPSRRTVRCIECTAAAHPTSDEPAPAPAPQAVSSDGLRLRAPASAVIAETLRVQADAPPRSSVARLFGRSPLSVEGRPWYLGAIGELEVGRVLDHLGPGWTVIHAVPVGDRGSDIDHLVVGPGGVFTINSKHHGGAKVWVGSKRLLVNGQRTDHLRNAEFEARRVAKLLTRAAGRLVEVTPIVAVVAARSITIREQPANVVVLAAQNLGRWLDRRPHVLGPDDVSHLQRLAVDEATWGSPAIQRADLERFAVLRESVVAARRRRQLWALMAMLSPAAIFALGLLGQLR